MIARYSRKPMSELWADRVRYQTWLEVEIAVCAELARAGVIPSKDWAALQSKASALLKRGGVDPSEVDRHEAVTKHDVIAFTTAVADEIGPVSRYIHFGLTSSDVVDTAMSLLIQRAGKVLLVEVDALIATLQKLAQRYRKLATVGRSHGIHAEPTSFGLKFLGYFEEWKRNRDRLVAALERLREGKLSGAVGVNAHWSPRFESAVLQRLGLRRCRVSTQVLPRDLHAELLCVLGIFGASMERVVVELRHLQRSEVGEVLEGFSAGQKGSSAMPHKRNPISSENLTGAARLLRAYAQTGFENVALWHERDISHSSVERVVFPDAFILCDYALARLQRVLNGMHVDEGRVGQNLDRYGKTVYSGHVLLALVQQGVTREEAYRWVQAAAITSLDRGTDFVLELGKNEGVQRLLSPQKLRELGSIKHQLRHVDEIFEGTKGNPASGKGRRA